MAQRPSPLGRYWCGDLGSGESDDCCPWTLQNIHFSDCSSVLHAIIQQTQITILLYMTKDADFVFQGVKSFLGACRALSDILATME